MKTSANTDCSLPSHGKMLCIYSFTVDNNTAADGDVAEVVAVHGIPWEAVAGLDIPLAFHHRVVVGGVAACPWVVGEEVVEHTLPDSCFRQQEGVGLQKKVVPARLIGSGRPRFS